MYHHSSVDYDVAASAAAAKGRVKMEEIIHKGRVNAQGVVDGIMSAVVRDTVVPATRLRLTYPDGAPTLLYGVEREVHPHAYGQMLDTAGIPLTFANNVGKDAGGLLWGKELVAHAFNEIMGHRPKARHLVRAEGDDGPVKGFLSDRFRRLDSRPLLDAFMGACVELGMPPIDGVASDTKCRVRAVLPQVFEPVENEVMIFGAEFGNSDYGDGGMVVNLWTMRVWCTNTAVTEKCLRQIHLGGRLPDSIEFSEETYRKDTAATASAIRDVVKAVVGPPRINRMLEAIRTADQTEIRGRDGIEKVLGKNALAKGELDTVSTMYEGHDVVNLPPGDTAWRLSNAVSFFAQGKNVSPDRRLELQDLAGKLVAGKSEKAAKEV